MQSWMKQTPSSTWALVLHSVRTRFILPFFPRMVRSAPSVFVCELTGRWSLHAGWILIFTVRSFIVIVGLLVWSASLRAEFPDCFEVYSFPNEARPEAKFFRCWYEALRQRMGQRELCMAAHWLLSICRSSTGGIGSEYWFILSISNPGFMQDWHNSIIETFQIPFFWIRFKINSNIS